MELEESAYWLELLEATQIKNGQPMQLLKRETDKLSAIFVTLIKKAKGLR